MSEIDGSVAEDREFSELLRSAAPPVPAVTGAVLTELHAVTRAAAGLRQRARRRRWFTGVGAVAALAASGVGGAAIGSQPAEDYSWGKGTSWASWAEHPAATLTYRLPGGGTCEQRLGEVDAADPASEAFATKFMRSTDLVAGADVRAAISKLRSEDYQVHSPDGKMVQGGFGTPFYNADYEYDQAVTAAVQTEILAAAAAAGHSGPSYTGQTRCKGETW
ncbi:hypothetical protein GCM10025864_15150 [Luteimicrobium album]|uniref:Uncharacterized protein n=1 Tax=Luteimicrobium album TaxID=1054550 RepID=A0ABQ6HZ44_9MICO|nr:hypothetical protein [Luteimicrobium album]GMA23756.1 hypothetical protein GCM10025864_15150 [Luteimicrobium album]